jgi:hypothetical protein
MLLRYLLIWLLLAVVAVANGILRQTTYAKALPELAAHQLSTATAILAATAVVWLVNRRWTIASASQACAIGLVWLLMTSAFEFGFGHYVAGHSWQVILSDYNLLQGRLWSLFLVWITVLPYVIFRLARNTQDRKEPR